MSNDAAAPGAADRHAPTVEQLLIRQAMEAFAELTERFEADGELQSAFRRLHLARLAASAISGQTAGPTRVTFTYKAELIEDLDQSDPVMKSKPKLDTMQQASAELEEKGQPVEGGGPPPNSQPVDTAAGSAGQAGSVDGAGTAPPPMRETMEAKLEASGGSIGTLFKSWGFKGWFRHTKEPIDQVQAK